MKILLFGITRDIVGQSELNGFSAEVESLVTVGELKEFLCSKYPELGKLSSLKIAVNQEFAGDETLITSTDEIAFIPPVSGG